MLTSEQLFSMQAEIINHIPKAESLVAGISDEASRTWDRLARSTEQIARDHPTWTIEVPYEIPDVEA